MISVSFLEAAEAREREGVMAMAEKDYAEAARCFVWAKEAYAKMPGFGQAAEQMAAKASNAQYMRDKEEKSLLAAIREKDAEAEAEIVSRAEAGEIIRII